MNFKKLLPAASVVFLLGLTGCSANTSSSVSSDFSCNDGGAAVALLSAETDLSQSPQVSFPQPLVSPQNQMKTITHGDGPQVTKNQTITTRISLYDGRSGEMLYDGNHSDMSKESLYLLINEETLKGSQFESILEPILCSTFGSRIAVTTPAMDVFDPDMLLMYQMAPNDALIFVVDIIDGFLSQADGRDLIVNNNRLPSVSFAPDGTPGLTFRNTEAPKELTVAQLKDGKHQQVKSDDSVIVHMTSWDWNDRRVLDSTWTTKAPSQIRLGTNANPLLPDDLLIGQNVGSQVMIVTPDVANDNATITVVDILGIDR